MIDSSQDVRLQCVEFGNISRADGSVIMSQGSSVMQVAVYGPTRVPPNRALIDKALVEVVYKPKVGISGCSERVKERLIKDTVECAILGNLHPRTSVMIILHDLQDDGSLLSCCINAACMALIDAGFSMKCLVAAVSVAITNEDEIILDPTTKQEKAAKALFTFAFDSITQKLVASMTKGCFSEAKYLECLQICRTASLQIFSFYRDSVKRRYSKAAENED